MLDYSTMVTAAQFCLYAASLGVMRACCLPRVPWLVSLTWALLLLPITATVLAHLLQNAVPSCASDTKDKNKFLVLNLLMIVAPLTIIRSKDNRIERLNKFRFALPY